MNSWLLISFAFTAFNTGLIWVIQVVHYPSFLHIDPSRYQDFQKFHMKGITFIVLPSMTIELGSTIALLWYWSMLPSITIYLISGIILLLIWLHTALLASPIHVALADQYSEKSIRKLIRINWYRTALWTMRFALMAVLIWMVL